MRPAAVVTLPQKTTVTRRKVQLLAQYLRARRHGPGVGIAWGALSQSDRDWWRQLAIQHLVAAEFVLEEHEAVALDEPIGVTAGVLAG